MTSRLSGQHVPLIQKLNRLNALGDDDIAAIQALPIRERHLKAGTVIASESQIISECCLLQSGFAFRHKVARDGQRQIVSFHFPGDILDIQHVLFDQADHNVQVMTDADVAFIPVNAMRELISDRPNVAIALWRDCLVDASIFREWVLNVGRRPADARIAHMLCEFMARCEIAGLGAATDIVLPMTQEHVGDATGLTAVHVNRVMRHLRESGLLEGKGRNVRVGDWQALRQVADFRPEYLHLAA